MNNVRQGFKKTVIGSIEVAYNIIECKHLTYEDLFGMKVYIFPLQNVSLCSFVFLSEPVASLDHTRIQCQASMIRTKFI